MNQVHLIFIIFLQCLFVHQDTDAQIFGGIIDRATRKIEQKLEDKIADAVADEIARRAFQPIEKSIDSLSREKYQDSLGKGQSVDWDKMGKSYAEFLNGMNDAVVLPEKFTFDISQDIEMVDYDKKKSNITLHYSEKQTILGFETIDKKNSEQQIVIMNVESDYVVLLTTDKNGVKKGQSIPNVMRLMTSLSNTAKENNKADKFTIKKTGKTKKIVGYSAEEYKGETEEEYVQMFTSTGLGVALKDSFTPYLQRFAPASYTDNLQEAPNGLIMSYENQLKSDKSKRSTWETKAISEKVYNIMIADYTFEHKKESGKKAK